MSSILFAFAGAAFLIIAHWAYRNDALRADAADVGLLKMKSDATPADAGEAETGKAGRGKTMRKRDGLGPKWKRAAPRRRG